MAPLADALERAGAGKLPAPARLWVLSRVAGAATLPEDLRNPGGLRCALTHRHERTDAPQAHRCAIVGGVPLAVFDNLQAGARELVATARRATATPASPAPDLERLADRIEVGWAPFVGPSDGEEATFRGLVADWEAFESGGVAGLGFLREDVKEWRAFRDEWRANEASMTGYTTNELVGMLNAEVERANRVRRELRDNAAKNKMPAPPMPGARRGLDVEAENPFATWLDHGVAKMPVLGWLTNPGGAVASDTAKVLKILLAVAAVLGLGYVASIAFVMSAMHR